MRAAKRPLTAGAVGIRLRGAPRESLNSQATARQVVAGGFFSLEWEISLAREAVIFGVLCTRCSLKIDLCD